MNGAEHHDDVEDIEHCFKVASALKKRLFKIGRSLNVVGGDRIDDGQVAIVCAAYARTVEQMLQTVLIERRTAARRRLS
jgi:hypothetical protein